MYDGLFPPTECDFIVHRKCEQKVNIDCVARLEQAVLQHDKQVEEADAAPDEPETRQVGRVRDNSSGGLVLTRLVLWVWAFNYNSFADGNSSTISKMCEIQ